MRRQRLSTSLQQLVPVVVEPQVVSQLVGEGAAAAAVAGDAESAAELGDAAYVQLGDDQVHEVRPDPVADGMHAVQMAVRRIPETVDVLVVLVGLGVVHLFSGHQRDARAHPALFEGPVGLGDVKVDHRIDPVQSPRGVPSRGRMEDGHVDPVGLQRLDQPPRRTRR